MGTTMNRQAYEKLIQGDLEYLLDREKTLERDHIEQVLRASIGFIYGIENKRINSADAYLWSGGRCKPHRTLKSSQF